MKKRTLFMVALALVPTTLPLTANSDQEEPILDLDVFIVRETSAYIDGGIEPNSRPVSGLFIDKMDVKDIPRSVTVLTPDHMELLQIDDLRSLSKFGAGTQLINHYGVTGTPIIRGAKGATLLNGMVRSFNLNEMPLSFGSSEALDIVKGPTPPHISPTHVGGFVNLVPKSPFFDKRRGSLEITVGNFNQYEALLDYGGPIMIGKHPAAFRISLTYHREEGYYDRLKNDFESAYASIKTDLTKNITFFGGFEFFHFKSNENPGWNRPTQNLIDNSEYIIGEPINLTDPDFQNTANRDLSSFPLGYGWSNGIQNFNALVVPQAVIDSAVAKGQISEAARDAMLNLSDSDDLARAYGQPLPSTGSVDPIYAAADSVSGKLAKLMTNPNSGYRYTKAYFDEGGIVFTSPIEGNQVLSDSSDLSEAFNWVGFADLTWSGANNTQWKNKFLFDTLKTEKLSSYGYAIDTKQFILANRIEGINDFDFAKGTTLSYGAGVRFTKAEMVQDYFAEPYSRRDISRKTVSSNSRVLTGPQIGPDGKNYWSPDIGANVKSDLLQSGLFAQLNSQLTEKLKVMLSARVEQAWYEASLPNSVQRAGESIRKSVAKDGDKTLYSLGSYITYEITDSVILYGAAQNGIALDLTQAGGVYGEDNFADADLLEVGTKWSLFNDRLQTTLSAWEWNQSRFNQRDFQSEPLEGEGIEFEATLTLIPEKLYLIASTEKQQIRRQTALGFRTLPQTDQEWALAAGLLNSGEIPYPENNPNLDYPGIPERTVKAHLVWKDENWKMALSGVYSESNWLNFEHTMKLPSSMLLSCFIGYNFGTWDMAITVENLTDEDYFLGADPLFASNALVTKGEPRKYALKFTKSF